LVDQARADVKPEPLVDAKRGPKSVPAEVVSETTAKLEQSVEANGLTVKPGTVAQKHMGTLVLSVTFL